MICTQAEICENTKEVAAMLGRQNQKIDTFIDLMRPISMYYEHELNNLE